MHENKDVWVFDSVEGRCWGPFANEKIAGDWIKCDKYLISWAVICMNAPEEDEFFTYYPHVYYHGWPLPEQGCGHNTYDPFGKTPFPKVCLDCGGHQTVLLDDDQIDTSPEW